MSRPTGPVLRAVALLGLPLLAALASVGCGKSSAAPEASVSEAVVAVPATAHPQRRNLTRVVEEPGRIEGFESTTLAVKVTGTLTHRWVDIKDVVHEGDLLATLEAPEMIREVQQKAAMLEQATAEVTLAERVFDAAKAAVKRAEANIKLAKASKGRTDASVIRRAADLDRAIQLARTNSVERAEVDRVRDEYATALANDAETEANIGATQAAKVESEAQCARAEFDVKVAKTKVNVAEAAYELARANAAYLDIYAPYDGVITERVGNIGDLMQPSGKAIVFRMMRIDKVRVWVDIPETEAVHIKTGQKAWLRVRSLDEREFEGQVTRDTHAFDPQSRTLRIQIDFDNKDQLLHPGSFATGRLIVTHPDVWTVPESAVWVQDDQLMVVRVENGVARRTPVRVGLRQGGFVQLLKKQVTIVPRGEPLPWDDWTGEEEIVVDNPSSVSDGKPLGKK